MGIKGRLVRAFAEGGNDNMLHFALKLLGMDGGEGSGNHDHAGRPGEVGGSAPSGQGSYSKVMREAASKSKNYVDFWMNLPEIEQKKFTSKEKLKEAFEQLKQSIPEGSEESEEPEWKPANGTKADMPKSVKVPEKFPEIKIVNNPDDTATAHAGTMGEIEINLANFDSGNIDSVIAHEAAHQLSNYDPELQQAIIMNYGNVLGRYNQKKHHFDGIYGEYNPEEAFATGFSNYLNYPDSMKEKYPDAYEFFDSLAKNQPETVAYLKGTVQEAKKELDKSKRADSEYYKQLDKRREIASKWSPERQAEFLYRQGFLTEEQAVEAMENGTASDRIKDYFDVMEYNGDPTPDKPIKKSPNLYDEISKGEHGGDWTQARKDYIQDWTGQSEEEAEETYKQLENWFGGSWYSADTATLDKYIDEDGAAGGEIFRGMHFTEDEYAAFMKGVQPGARIGMNGHNSSWTSDRETAWGFSRNGDRHVIICCKKNKTSAPVSHLSSKGEDEILAHSRAQWTVIGVTEGNGRTEITVIEAEERMSEEERNRRKAGSDSVPNKDDGSSLESRMNGQNRFLKVTAPPEWLFKHTAEDGGPGSGNFGHKGRPGKVGGSGAGGGKQYRGGRSDIGYYGSRKDWLNGLQGERQTKAVRAIAKHKKDLENAVKLKERITDLGNKGMLTFQEVEERLKEANLDNITPNMAPEEFALRRGNPTEQKQLLDLMKESRSWDEKKDKLIDENLDENEKKTLEFLSNEDLSKYTDADKAKEANQIKNLLEAKAMGAFESEIDVPDEIQYGAGTKERPTVTVKTPQSSLDNDDWYSAQMHTNPTDERLQTISSIMSSTFNTRPFGFYGSSMNNPEQVMILKTDYANGENAEEKITDLNRYLSLKDSIFGGEYFKVVDSGNKNNECKFDNLDDNAERTVFGLFDDLLNESNEDNNQDNDISQIGDILEFDFLRDKDISQDVRSSYLTLKAVALGTPDYGIDIRKCVNTIEEYRKKRKEERALQTKIKNMTPEERKQLRYPETVAGVSRRPEGDMSFDEADGKKANDPEWGSVSMSKKGNCQTCVIAYEARLRGYDVFAKLKGGDANSIQLEIGRDATVAWIDPETGKSPKFIKPKKRLTAETGVKWLDETIKPGERYFFSVKWKTQGAHITTISRDADGELKIYDPQDGSIAKGKEAIYNYLKIVKLNETARVRGSRLLRVDNLLFNSKMVDQILRGK